MATRWTEERRARQAEAIRRWKPWKRSTGPRTVEGKATAAMNGLKHGGRSQARQALDRAVAALLEGVRG